MKFYILIICLKQLQVMATPPVAAGALTLHHQQPLYQQFGQYGGKLSGSSSITSLPRITSNNNLAAASKPENDESKSSDVAITNGRISGQQEF